MVAQVWLRQRSPDALLIAEVVEFACGIASELKGELVENVSSGMDTYSIRQPLGVSYFFPFLGSCNWLASALAHGKRTEWQSWR